MNTEQLRAEFEAWAKADGHEDFERLGEGYDHPELREAWRGYLAGRAAPQPTDPDAATIADYEAVLLDHRRLVRELDVLLNGEEGAAQQASLCDIVAQVRREGIKTAEPVKVPSEWRGFPSD